MTTIRSGLSLGHEAAVWALRFYRRHLLLVVGLSMIPAVARFILVFHLDSLPGWAALAAEVVTESTRVILVVAILVLAFRAEPDLAPLSVRGRWSRFIAGVEADTGAFYTQFALLGAAFLVFDLTPNLTVAALTTPRTEPFVTAVVVAVKNPTVIALTFCWMIGVGVVLAGRVGIKTAASAKEETPR